ncbi:MAG TPA: GNAT family N-acetyltransferase [Anaerolineae bacterium]|nr:GNAT family N-acetyltransferase [Anaerolineae bacterium]
MKPTMRWYRDEDDYWRIRAFLRDVFLLNGRRERSWHVARLDYWRWHLIATCECCPPVPEVTLLWETAAGDIAAVLHPVYAGEVFLHMNPAFRTQALEEEVLAVAEERFAADTSDGRRYLVVNRDRDDELRLAVLTERGYRKWGEPVHHWSRDLDAAIPAVPVAAGYTIRSMGDVDEHPARSWASWRAFHPDDPDEAYEGWEWYSNIQAGPLYRRDLDVVAATEAGEIAAFCTIWYDDVTRSGVCVLVGTAAEHQRRGLGKAVIWEGLRRMQRLGGTRAFANGYDAAANALYGAALGTLELSDSWVKTW